MKTSIFLGTFPASRLSESHVAGPLGPQVGELALSSSSCSIGEIPWGLSRAKPRQGPSVWGMVYRDMISEKKTKKNDYNML